MLPDVYRIEISIQLPYMNAVANVNNIKWTASYTTCLFNLYSYRHFFLYLSAFCVTLIQFIHVMDASKSVSTLPNDTLAYRLEKAGIEPPIKKVLYNSR